ECISYFRLRSRRRMRTGQHYKCWRTIKRLRWYSSRSNARTAAASAAVASGASTKPRNFPRLRMRITLHLWSGGALFLALVRERNDDMTAGYIETAGYIRSVSRQSRVRATAKVGQLSNGVDLGASAGLQREHVAHGEGRGLHVTAEACVWVHARLTSASCHHVLGRDRRE